MKNKIIFWLGGDFTHFCLAYNMQQKYNADYYAIIDITNKPKKFFEEQDLVKFQKTWYFFDNVLKPKQHVDLDFLSSFEKKYKINLWKLAANERIFYRFFNFHKFTNNEILSILEQECKLFEQIFEEIKPNFLITKWPSRHHHQLFYELCNSQNIKVLMLGQPKIGFKGMISQDGEIMDNISDLSEMKSSGRNFEELRSYLKSFMVNRQIKTLHEKQESSTSIQLLKSGFKFFTSENKQTETQYYYFGRSKSKVFLSTINSILRKKYRKNFIEKNLKKNFDDSTPFVYFPLAVDMERTLLISAPFFTNQIEIIRHIVKSLPINYRLILKENPAQISREWRSISEYNEILDIPNVTLLHPSVSPEKLYKKCSLVISIAGSSGFEASFFGKPSIVFSDVPYAVLPSVYRIKEIEELPNVIRTSLQKKVDASDLDKYVQFLEKNTFEFDRMGLASRFNELFYYGGNLIDVEIPIDKMKLFLDENRDVLNKLASEHINKIKIHDYT